MIDDSVIIYDIIRLNAHNARNVHKLKIRNLLILRKFQISKLYRNKVKQNRK